MSARSTSVTGIKALAAPSKKHRQKDADIWPLGWWDFIPLIEGNRRPIQWAGTSTLLTAHPYQPQVLCTQFPSSKNFTIPSPHPLSSSPTSYEPATVISVSPLDNWLFAYFPGKSSDGVGCLWKRGPQLDNWIVKEWWTFARGVGVVQAKWLGADREWILSEDGFPTRMPALGPPIAFSNAILFLVTQSHMLTVCYVHPQTESIKMHSTSLCSPSSTTDGEQDPATERVDGPRGVGLCTHAAIGFGYNESTIIIATHSRRVPSPPSEMHTPNPVDLSISMATPPPISEPSLCADWETWGEDTTLGLCEISLAFKGHTLALSTHPLPPISAFSRPNSFLTDLTFVATNPNRPSEHYLPSTPTFTSSTPTRGQFSSTPISSPSLAHSTPKLSPGRLLQRSPGKGTPSKMKAEKRVNRSDGKLYLISAFINFGDYTSQPKSELTLLSFTHETSSFDTAKQYWTHHHQVTHSLPSGVITFLVPSLPLNSTNDCGILVNVVDADGVTRRRHGTDVQVGKVHVLTLPDLKPDENWESSNTFCPADALGADPPFSMAISPNNVLLCTVSSSSTSAARTSVQPYPARRLTEQATKNTCRSHLSGALAVAIHKRTVPSDIIHSLSLDSTPIKQVEETLEGTMQIFETEDQGLGDMWIADLLGVAVEVYRLKSSYAKSEADKEDLSARWQTGQDICSMVACCMAWEDCIDEDGYDLDALWQLVGLAGWFIGFVEKLMKESVLSASEEDACHSSDSKNGVGDVPSPMNEDDDDLFGSTHPLPQSSSFSTPILLHLVHPFALSKLHSVLNHVKRFRAYLGSLSARGESAQIAKDILVDSVDCSGVNIDALEKTVSDFIGEVNGSRVEYARASFASLQPSPETYQLLRKIVLKITESKIIDRPRLFIKPADLLDGILRLSISGQIKSRGLDVVSKGLLTRPPMMCLRCSGKSELGSYPSVPGHTSYRWAAWERLWVSHCICGGSWSGTL